VPADGGGRRLAEAVNVEVLKKQKHHKGGGFSGKKKSGRKSHFTSSICLEEISREGGMKKCLGRGEWGSQGWSGGPLQRQGEKVKTVIRRRRLRKTVVSQTIEGGRGGRSPHRGRERKAGRNKNFRPHYLDAPNTRSAIRGSCNRGHNSKNGNQRECQISEMTD